MTQSKNHILIIDGTLSKLDKGFETHCGKLFKLLTLTDGKARKIYYDHGVQGSGFYKWINIASGQGINHSIIRSYQRLSENFRSGDKIFLFGYSRGAYAVRLLSGMIDKMGLLKPEYATKALAEQAFEIFANQSSDVLKKSFRAKYALPVIDIEFIGVWDTVKALGLPIPILRRYSPFSVSFRDNALPSNIRYAAHALALDEDRAAYRPELWVSHGPNSKLNQTLFRGTHSIIGGQCYDIPNAELLSNVTLIWMLEIAQAAGLVLPESWRARYPANYEIELQLPRKLSDYFWRREPRKFSPKTLFKVFQIVDIDG